MIQYPEAQTTVQVETFEYRKATGSRTRATDSQIDSTTTITNPLEGRSSSIRVSAKALLLENNVTFICGGNHVLAPEQNATDGIQNQMHSITARLQKSDDSDDVLEVYAEDLDIETANWINSL